METHARIRRVLFAVAVLAVAPAACAAGRDPQEARMSAGAAERYEMRRVQLTEVAFTPAGDGAFARDWKARLARIEALKADREIPDDQNGEILERRTLKPGMFEGVMYFATDSALVTFGALLGADAERGLWLQETFSRKFAGRVIDSTAALGLAYRLRPRTEEPWPIPGKDWFHLAHGAVALPFQDQEEAEAGFEGHELKVKFTIETESTDEPEKKGLARKFSEALANAGAQFAGAVAPVKQRGRTAAGLAGEEMVMRDVDGKKLYFMWSFPGEARSGTKPRVVLKMETRDDRYDEKVALWDRLVDSLAPASR